MLIPVITIVVVIIAMAASASLVIGILRWQQPMGKIVAVLGGLLLVALLTFFLVLFVIFVFFIPIH